MAVAVDATCFVSVVEEVVPFTPFRSRSWSAAMRAAMTPW
jgi:hypothetical protein